MSPEFTVAFAGLQASLHSIRMIANAGLVSPEDVDQTLEGISKTLEALPEDISGKFLAALDPQFARIKQTAKANWNRR